MTTASHFDATRLETDGAAGRRGPFRLGDRVQLTDPRGRLNTIELKPGGSFQSHRGYFRHEALVGQPEGCVVTNTEGVQYLAFRPLLSDYVLSMPRGAQVIYPKDSAQIISLADVFPGAVVLEAGVGSGGMTLALLRAVGDGGQLISIERRAEFAEVARGNVAKFFGGIPESWRLLIGDFADRAPEAVAEAGADAVVLDMLAPWENLAAVATALRPGGVFCAYVATTTQLSRLVEDLRETGWFAEPVASETMLRTWHLEGLAVRPDHRMIGHTGFLLTARRLAPGVVAPIRKRRPAKGAGGPHAKLTAPAIVAEEGTEGGDPGGVVDEGNVAEVTVREEQEFTEAALGVRDVSDRKLRRALRDLRPVERQEDDVD